MGIPRGMRVGTGKGKTIGITPDEEALAWLSKHMGPSERWSGPTHFFNWAVKHVKAEEAQVAEILKQDRLDLLRDFLALQAKAPADEGDKPSKKGKP